MPACQGEDFYPAFPLTADRREVLVCAKCEHQAIFSELVGKPGATASAAKMPWARPALSCDARAGRDAAPEPLGDPRTSR